MFGSTTDDKTIQCCVPLVCRDGNDRCKNAFKGCGATASWDDGEWALCARPLPQTSSRIFLNPMASADSASRDTCPLSTESNPIMCCIGNPRALGLPHSSDGILSFNPSVLPAFEENAAEPEPEPEFPWTWDTANGELPDSSLQAQTQAQMEGGGFETLAFATDSSLSDTDSSYGYGYGPENEQYSPFMIDDDWAALG